MSLRYRSGISDSDDYEDLTEGGSILKPTRLLQGVQLANSFGAIPGRFPKTFAGSTIIGVGCDALTAGFDLDESTESICRMASDVAGYQISSLKEARDFAENNGLHYITEECDEACARHARAIPSSAIDAGGAMTGSMLATAALGVIAPAAAAATIPSMVVDLGGAMGGGMVTNACVTDNIFEPEIRTSHDYLTAAEEQQNQNALRRADARLAVLARTVGSRALNDFTQENYGCALEHLAPDQIGDVMAAAANHFESQVRDEVNWVGAPFAAITIENGRASNASVVDTLADRLMSGELTVQNMRRPAENWVPAICQQCQREFMRGEQAAQRGAAMECVPCETAEPAAQSASSMIAMDDRLRDIAQDLTEHGVAMGDEANPLSAPLRRAGRRRASRGTHTSYAA